MRRNARSATKVPDEAANRVRPQARATAAKLLEQAAEDIQAGLEQMRLTQRRTFYGSIQSMSEVLIPKYFRFFAITFIACYSAAVAGSPADASVYTCSYDVKRYGTSGSARIEVRDGVIRKARFDNHFRGSPGNLGYSCYLDANRGDGETEWKETGNAIEIKFDNPDFDDFMTISPTADGFLIDMSNTRSGDKCGAGAELPKRLTVYRSTRKCKTEGVSPP